MDLRLANLRYPPGARGHLKVEQMTQTVQLQIFKQGRFSFLSTYRSVDTFPVWQIACYREK